MSDETRLADLLLRYQQLLEQQQPVRPEDLCADCPELADELKKRIQTLTPQGLLCETTVKAEPGPEGIRDDASLESVADGLRYRPLRFHAKGGLGEVFVAEDAELHREVALKRIHSPRADDPASRRRFLLEAEITGRLEHPGIVPVYGLVHDEEGLPSYAMRFVQGQTLQEAIRHFHAADKPGRDPSERSLALRQLLNRFIAVCNTVAYAHSRGILHRDVKPSNIMLGKYGETLLLDWGLAKPFERGAEARAVGEETLAPSSGSSSGSGTQIGSAVGTPSYMSPEQAAGDWDRVGPASDIYSLGATLYAILTGEPPFHARDLKDSLSRVQQGDFRPPRERKKGVPAALEATCLKAMAREPADRYATPLELAAEIENWLADEPVEAYREPLLPRLSRLGRRHKVAVAGAAGLLFTALIALLISTILIGREQRRTERALEQARVNEADAQRQREAAQKQQKRAETNYQKAIAAVNRMLTQVGSRHLAHIPQMEEVRERLLKDALRFYQGFLEQESQEPEIRREMARIYLQTAMIHEMLGQLDKDEADIRQALKLLEGLVAEFPNDLQYRTELAGAHNELALLYRRTVRNAEAEPVLTKAIAMMDEIAREHPRAAKELDGYREYLGNMQNNLGLVYHETDRFLQAEAFYKKALDLRLELAGEHADNPEYPNALATSYSNLGALYHSTGRDPEAETAFHNARKLQEVLARDHPIVPEFQHDLAKTCFNLGVVYRAMGRDADAEKSSARAERIWLVLVRDHPRLSEYQFYLAHTYSGQGRIYFYTDRTKEAEVAYQKAIAILEKLTKLHPKAFEYHALLAEIYSDYGFIHYQTNRMQPAEALYQKALPVLESLVLAQPKMPSHEHRLAAVHVNTGLVCAATGRPQKADEAYQRALLINEKLARAYPQVVEYQHLLAKNYLNLGILRGAAKQTSQAEALFHKALAVLEPLVRDHASDPDYRSDLALAFQNLGALYRDAERRTEAEVAFRMAAGAWEHLARAHPETFSFQNRLATTNLDLGGIYLELNRVADAEAVLQKAVKSLEQLVEKQPDVPVYQVRLAEVYAELGELYRKAKRISQAEATLQKQVAVLERLVQEHPKVASYRNSLGSAQADLGRLFLDLRRYPEAEAAHLKAKDWFKQLATEDPTIPEYQNNEASALVRLGVLHKHVKRPAEAETSFKEALSILERVVRDHPNDHRWILGIARVYEQMGHLFRDEAKVDAALSWYMREAQTLEPLVSEDDQNAEAKQELGSAYFEQYRILTKLDRHDEALKLSDRALKLGPGPGRIWVPFGRAATLARLGDHARAITDAETAAGKNPTLDDLYNLACVYSLASAAVLKDAKLPQAERDKLGEQHVAHAIGLLSKAHAAGFFKEPSALDDLKSDPDLAPLRSRAEFKKLLSEVEKGGQG